jgi:mono/diheme cytochrome c family protein
MTMTVTRVLRIAVASLPIAICAPASLLAEPVTASPDLQGAAIFREQCASCHGSGAKGDGPVATALKVPPADLTTIAKRAGGTFPAARIAYIIAFGENVSSHGTQAMPVWGRKFTDEGGGGRRGGLHSRRAVVELVRYLRSIQQP